jgi:SNF2 family DNA or RNA helicase
MRTTATTIQQRKTSEYIHIELIESTILLSGISLLKLSHFSQLVFYGFTRENEYHFRKSDTPVQEINKLTQFFDKEQIAYKLSDELNVLIQNDQEERQKLQEVFVRSKKIKEEGILDESFTEFRTFTASLPRKLRPHQLKSAYHFYSLRNGANFSVPGSGKTSTILTVYEKLRQEGICNLLFIVGPPSCFQPWQNEFRETLGRKAETRILSGGNKNYRKREYERPQGSISELYLSTFHTAMNDTREIMSFLSQTGINAFMVIDEAHYIKQQGGSWASSLLEIGRHAICRGVLTGTPIPKSYKDLFNLFDFLWEGNCSLTKEDKARIEAWEKRKNTAAIKKLLDQKISPLFYRVRKKDLGLRPAQFHEPIVVPMNATERLIYDSVSTKILDLSERDYAKNEEILSRLWRGRMIRLRQSVSYPGLLASAIEESSEKLVDNDGLRYKIGNYKELEIPGKLKALTDLVMDIRKRDRKILIWSNFVGTLEMIRDHFREMGLHADLIYGKTPVRKDDTVIIGEEKTREDIRDEFLDMESDLDILIANPAACAESISLHKTCFHAIYYDLSYNCSQYLQSLDRIHRVGGSELHEANYYFLQYENSIDQDIKQNLELKAKKMYEIIDQDYTIYDLNLEENEDDDIEAYKRLIKTRH